MTLMDPTIPHTRRAAIEAVNNLPTPRYTENYQPHYPNSDELLEAVHELHETTPVTTPEQVDELQAQLTELAEGRLDRPIILTGRCAEDVNLEVPIRTLVRKAVGEYRHITSIFASLGKTALIIQRNRGQATKPRSAALEELQDGRIVPPYMGQAINGTHPDHRIPDPTRLVSTATQSRDLEAGMTKKIGSHVPAAHEALSLAYESGFVRDGYLLSADLPWVGKRTNALDGEHVKLLAKVKNPIGIKIGADSTPEHIAGLQAILNPGNIPGKLVFMLRVGPGNAEALNTVLTAIKQHAPKAILMYDIHGVTRTAPTGEKIRYTGDIIQDIRNLSAAVRNIGLKLHGLHLETIRDSSRLECVDHPDQLPTHPGGVDPQLIPRQTEHVLRETADCLL